MNIVFIILISQTNTTSSNYFLKSSKTGKMITVVNDREGQTLSSDYAELLCRLLSWMVG